MSELGSGCPPPRLQMTPQPWPAAEADLGYLRLRSFPELESLGAKPGTVPGKRGWLVTWLTARLCPHDRPQAKGPQLSCAQIPNVRSFQCLF